MLPSYRQHFRYILRKPQLPQSFIDMLCGYGLLRFLLRYLVGFGGNEGDEFDAAVD